MKNELNEQLDKIEDTVQQAIAGLCLLDGDGKVWDIISDLLSVKNKLRLYKSDANSTGDTQ